MPTLGTALDFAKYEARNLRHHQLASAPGAPVTGQQYYNTADNTLYWWNGTAWLTAGGLTQAAADARYLPLSLADAKGDLFAASADNTVARLPLGTNGQVLTADSAQTLGLRWATPAAGGGLQNPYQVINPAAGPASGAQGWLGSSPTDNWAYLAYNAHYTGPGTWAFDDTAQPAVVWTASSTQALGIYRAPASANPPGWVGKLGLSSAGTLSITPDIGQTYALTTTRGSVLLYNHGNISVADSANTISGGWQWRDAGGGIEFLVNGAPIAGGGTVIAQDGSIQAKGTFTSIPGSENLSGTWLCNSGGARLAFEGMEGDNVTWRVYSNYAGQQGNKLSVNTSNGYVSIPGGLGVTGVITTTGGLTGNGSVLSINSTANIQLNPSGNIVHPSANATQYLGWTSLEWLSLFAQGVQTAGQLSLNAGAHVVATSGGGGWCVYLRAGSHVWVNGGGSPNAVFGCEVDNKMVCGGTGNRWQYVCAVNGAINTCRADEKAILGEVDPVWALDALTRTPVKLYHPKDWRGVVDDTLTFAGIVDDCADPRMQIRREGSFTSATHQSGLTVAAVQALAAELTDLRAEVARLKEALSA